jgi:CRP/FNR family cyclic AMP-dependent transcriptional regulator
MGTGERVSDDKGVEQTALTSAVQLDVQLRERRIPSSRPLARRLTARVLRVPRGNFDAEALVGDPEGWLGLLVLDGLIAVGIEAGRAQSTWLVGGEDLIRPWNMQDVSLLSTPSWRALTETRVALLDRDFSRRMGGIPLICSELLARATQTTHWLLAKSLVSASPIVEERLMLLFSMLSERWGRVCADGVRLDLPLTHELLAKMCGARRPSVTTALRSLRERGLIDCTRRGCWMVRRDLVGTELPWSADALIWRRNGRARAADGQLEELTAVRAAAAGALDGASNAMVA